MSKKIIAPWLALGVFLILGLYACSDGQISEPDGMPAPIDVRVWVDKNRDGRRTIDEIPRSGVVVQLVDLDTGRVVDENSTDSNGEAEVVGLQGLLPEYHVRIIPPDGYVATTESAIPVMEIADRSLPISFGIVTMDDT